MRLRRTVRQSFLSLFALLALLSQSAIAQSTTPAGTPPVGPTLSSSGQVLDDDFAKSVKEWTTRPEFISPLVDHLPKAQGVPTPKDILGYHIGQPKKLTYTTDLYRYYRALAAASPRVTFIKSCRSEPSGRFS